MTVMGTDLLSLHKTRREGQAKMYVGKKISRKNNTQQPVREMKIEKRTQTIQ
jgi:hypothetical protein